MALTGTMCLPPVDGEPVRFVDVSRPPCPGPPSRSSTASTTTQIGVRVVPNRRGDRSDSVANGSGKREEDPGSVWCSSRLQTLHIPTSPPRRT